MSILLSDQIKINALNFCIQETHKYEKLATRKFWLANWNSQLANWNSQLAHYNSQLANFNSQLTTRKINSHTTTRNSQILTRNSQNQLASYNSQLSTGNSQLADYPNPNQYYKLFFFKSCTIVHLAFLHQICVPWALQEWWAGWWNIFTKYERRYNIWKISSVDISLGHENVSQPVLLYEKMIISFSQVHLLLTLGSF